VVNNCSYAVTLQSLTATSSGPFSLPSFAPISVTGRTTSAPIAIGFQPIVPGTYYADLQLQTDLQAQTFGIAVSGTAIDAGTQLDEFQPAAPKVDLLFVMDTTHGNPAGAALSNVVNSFLIAATSRSLDYQVGVTTTDVCAGTSSEDGRLLPCPPCKVGGSSALIVRPDDADPPSSDLDTLVDFTDTTPDACAAMYAPQFFEAAYEALNGSVTYNQGFFRSDAAHVVVAVSGDSDDDASPQDPQWYAQALAQIGDPNHPQTISFNYASANGFADGGLDVPLAALPTRLSALVTQMNGLAMDTTSPDWGLNLDSLWPQGATQARYFLSGVPDSQGMQLFLDGPPPSQTPAGGTSGQAIAATNPNGTVNWTYDAVTNSFSLNTATIALSANDVLYVAYTLACP
jgi:hypothetical protein